MVMGDQAEVDSSIIQSRAQKSNVDDNNNNYNNNNNNNGDHNHHIYPTNLGLGRQSSIYSLTLDEFQHTLCESGKNFGSMNMDEFLNSIWTAEENQAQAQAHMTQFHHDPDQINGSSGHSSNMLEKQPSLNLARQGSLSLSLPAPLCRKTVDEVWLEIQKSHQQKEQEQEQQQQQQQQQQRAQNQSANMTGNGNTGSAQRQPTFGEMTLEDFLVKAGVVREQPQCGPSPIQTPVAVVPTQHHPQFGYPNSHPQIGPGQSFVGRPMMPAYPAAPASAGDQGTGYGLGPKRNNGYPTVGCYGGTRGNNGGHPGPGPAMSPVSPVSSDGLCGPGTGGQYGMELGGLRGRKRGMDGPVEKVVERRQRRMIKNRESAARSRARKQAYTVELEAELNQLREENAQLKQAMADMERHRKQQYVEEPKQVVFSRARRAQERIKTMRRSRSCDL